MMLGNRQLAMLREMGVRVWQPTPTARAQPGDIKSEIKSEIKCEIIGAPRAALPAVSAPGKTFVSAPVPAPADADADAIDSVAARARSQSAKDSNHLENLNTQLPREPALQSAAELWRLGAAHALYPPAQPATGARWLVLLESSGDAWQSPSDALQGDADKLLDNMLRAAGLHTAGGVTLAPLARDPAGFADTESSNTVLATALSELVASLQPTVILVMGRLAAQAVLQCTEPLAKLRGRTHLLHGTSAVVTLEPVYLLRNPLDKAKAWDDLCLALSLAGA